MWKIRVCNVNLFSDQLSKSHVLHCNGFALLCLCCWQWYHWGLAKPGLTMLDSLSLCCTDSDTDPSAAKHCLEQNVHYLPPVDCPRSMTVATIFYILSLQCPDPDSDSPSTFFKSNSFHSESPFPLQLLPHKGFKDVAMLQEGQVGPNKLKCLQTMLPLIYVGLKNYYKHI